MSESTLPTPIVSPQWLSTHLRHAKVKILDASFSLSSSPGGSSKPNCEIQIPGSQFFDFDKRICDQSTSLPHMMPSAELFSREVQLLGIDKDSLIVIYDRTGIYSSPRAWWMFKAMGHLSVAVLEGGFPAWLEAGFPTESKEQAKPLPGNFIANPQPRHFSDRKAVRDSFKNPPTLIIDARSEGRFMGVEPEPRPGLRRGHIPASVNLPFQAVLMGNKLRGTEDLKSIFSKTIGEKDDLIFSCGSGVTACILALAAETAGYKNITVYDGSWSEWGSFPEQQNDDSAQATQHIVMRPIGRVKSSRKETIDDEWDAVDVSVSLNPAEFSAESLAGLETFSHVEIIFYMDKVDPTKVESNARHPRNNPDWPIVGIFAQRGKNRPNQIGLTICRIKSVQGHEIFLEGLDAVDGTPVLDIKPWVKEFAPRGDITQPPWISELMEKYWS